MNPLRKTKVRRAKQSTKTEIENIRTDIEIKRSLPK